MSVPTTRSSTPLSNSVEIPLTDKECSRIVDLRSLPNISKKSIKAHHSQHGKVLDIYFWSSNSNNKHAFVTFSTADAARRAISHQPPKAAPYLKAYIPAPSMLERRYQRPTDPNNTRRQTPSPVMFSDSSGSYERDSSYYHPSERSPLSQIRYLEDILSEKEKDITNLRWNRDEAVGLSHKYLTDLIETKIRLDHEVYNARKAGEKMAEETKRADRAQELLDQERRNSGNKHNDPRQCEEQHKDLERRIQLLQAELLKKCQMIASLQQRDLEDGEYIDPEHGNCSTVVEDRNGPQERALGQLPKIAQNQEIQTLSTEEVTFPEFNGLNKHQIEKLWPLMQRAYQSLDIITRTSNFEASSSGERFDGDHSLKRRKL